METDGIKKRQQRPVVKANKRTKCRRENNEAGTEDGKCVRDGEGGLGLERAARKLLSFVFSTL